MCVGGKLSRGHGWIVALAVGSMLSRRIICKERARWLERKLLSPGKMMAPSHSLVYDLLFENPRHRCRCPTSSFLQHVCFCPTAEHTRNRFRSGGMFDVVRCLAAQAHMIAQVGVLSLRLHRKLWWTSQYAARPATRNSNQVGKGFSEECEADYCLLRLTNVSVVRMKKGGKRFEVSLIKRGISAAYAHRSRSDSVL